MHVVPLQMKQYPAQIAIKQDSGQLQIRQPQAKVMINIEKPVVHIERRAGSLQVDQSRALAAYGIIPTVKLTSRMMDQIPGMVQQSIAKMARNGDRLAAIHQSTEMIPQLAKENMLEPSVGLHYIGKASRLNVDIHFTADEVLLEAQEGQVDIQVEPQKPILHHIPAQVTIGMQQYPSIRFEWPGKHINQQL